MSGLALAVGPVVGGALVGVWDWRAIFWFNLAFGLAALAAGVIVLPENSDPDAHRVDIAGTVLAAAALTAFVFAVIGGEDSGFGSARVLVLLGLSAVATAAFLAWESRAAHPLLDLRYLRVPRFLTANVVAFCAYFATFAVFFFTALYLEEVVGDSGYQIALVFLPMTTLMIAASLLAGRWTSAAGPRWSIFTGCVLFSAGLLLTSLTLSPNPPYAPLALALALTGVGIGTTVVPITSSALSAVPPERSGMAASAANTSREIGAVTGVAILGALVNAQLHSDLIARLRHLGIPANFQSIVINAIETGTVPSSGHATTAGPAGEGTLVQEVIHAAYSAFYAGLHAALYLSAFLVLAAGLFTVVAFGQPHRAHRPPGPGPLSDWHRRSRFVVEQRDRIVRYSRQLLRGGVQGGQLLPGHAVVVTAEQQVGRMRPGRGRWHHHPHHRHGRTAAGGAGDGERRLWRGHPLIVLAMLPRKRCVHVPTIARPEPGQQRRSSLDRRTKVPYRRGGSGSAARGVDLGRLSRPEGGSVGSKTDGYTQTTCAGQSKGRRTAPPQTPVARTVMARSDGGVRVCPGCL